MNTHSARSIPRLKVISLIISNLSLHYRLDRLRRGFTSIVSAKDAKGKALLGAEVIA